MYTQQAFKENSKYGYASGRIHVLEMKLINRAALTRLLEADSPQEVLRILSESGYGAAFSDAAVNFEDALQAEMSRVYNLVDELTMDPLLTQIFRIRWDFHNIKILLKASYLKESSYDGSLVSFGVTPVEGLKLAIEPESEKKGEPIPDYLMNAINGSREQYETNQNPQIIDIVIDNHLHSFMYKRVKSYPNSFLRGYFEAIADLNNIRSFVRVRMLGENIRLLDSVLLPYGMLDKNVFLQRFDDNIESWTASLTNTPYGELVTEGFRRWSEDHSLAVFEKLSDNYLIDYIKPAKYIIFGVEPLIGYFLAKEHEIKLIRIIMIGKLNDLPTEIINERLRDTYV